MGSAGKKEDQKVRAFARYIAEGAGEITDAIDVHQTDEFLNVLVTGRKDKRYPQFKAKIPKRRKTYVSGAGRSGMVAKAFAMRLMHMGFRSYVAGETNTPAFNRGDVMVIFSGSADKDTTKSLVSQVHGLGGTVCLITTNHDAARILNIEGNNLKMKTCVVFLSKTPKTGNSQAVAPMGTLFETASLIFADAVISRMMEIFNLEESALRKNHWNLEGINLDNENGEKTPGSSMNRRVSPS